MTRNQDTRNSNRSIDTFACKLDRTKEVLHCIDLYIYDVQRLYRRQHCFETRFPKIFFNQCLKFSSRRTTLIKHLLRERSSSKKIFSWKCYFSSFLMWPSRRSRKDHSGRSTGGCWPIFYPTHGRVSVLVRDSLRLQPSPGFVVPVSWMLCAGGL